MKKANQKIQRENRHLMRRVLVPLLVVAFPVAAMMAFIVHYKRVHRPAGTDTPPVTETASFGNDDWPVFRGDAGLTGRAVGTLPEELTLAWTFQAAAAVRSTPIVANGKVFVSSMDKHLYAIDPATGAEIWRFEADDELEASPLYHQGVVYVGSNGGTFYAVNAADGQSIRTFKTDGKITGSANIATHFETGRDVILFGSYDDNLYCLDAETGEKVFAYPAESYINGAIAVFDNTAIFGSCDANLYQVPIADPNAAKSIDAGSYVATNPAVDKGVIFAGTYDGVFLAANIKTQTILWHFEPGEGAFLSAPAVNDAVVVVGCRDGNVYCLDRVTGKKRWAFTAQDNFDSSPVICGSTVAIGCDDGRLYLLDVNTGQEVFSYTLGNPIVSSAAIAQNRLLIGCENGTVYAFTEK